LAKNPSEGSGDNHAGNYELRIENGSRAPNLLFETGAPNSTQGHLASPEHVVPEGQWTHLAVTAAAGGDLKFYLNGDLVETAEAAIPPELGRPIQIRFTSVRGPICSPCSMVCSMMSPSSSGC
jgi:hypothetical protein